MTLMNWKVAPALPGWRIPWHKNNAAHGARTTPLAHGALEHVKQTPERPALFHRAVGRELVHHLG